MFSLVFRALMRRVYRDVTAGDFRLVRAMTADDATFVFPGSSSFGGTYHGQAEILAWLSRFAALHPRIDVLDVAASGPPWNTRVAVRFDDAIGGDYRNNVLEMCWVRWGKMRRLEVFLDTERVTTWEQLHPELTTATA